MTKHLNINKKRHIRFLKLLFKLGIIILIIPFAVYIPFVQGFVIEKIENRISKEIDAEISIKKFSLSFFADIELENITITNKKDTLLALKEISIDIELKPLFDNKLVIDNLNISNLTGDLDKVIPKSDTTNKQNQTKTENNEAYEIIVNNLTIIQSDLSYFNVDMNMIMEFKIGNLIIENIKVDSFLVKADKVVLENTWIDYVSPYIEEIEGEVDTSVINFILQITDVQAKNSSFYYNDSLMEFKTGGNVKTNDLVVDLTKTLVNFDKGCIENGFFNFIYINDTIDTVDIDDNFWKVKFNCTELKNSDFTYDVSYLPENTNSFDYNHIHLNKITGNTKNFFFSFHKIYGKLGSITFVENNKIFYNNIKGDVYADDNVLKMNNVELVTKNSKIQIDGETGFYVYDYVLKNSTKTNICLIADIEKWTDLEYFSSERIKAVENYDKIKDKKIALKTQLVGNADSLNIKIKLDYDNNAYLCSHGNIKNIDAQNPIFDLVVSKLSFSQQFANNFINKEIAEYLPQQVFICGLLKGNLNKQRFNGMLNSDYGKQKVLFYSDLSNKSPFITVNINGNFIDRKKSDLKIDSINIQSHIQGTDLENIVAGIDIKLKGIEIDSIRYDNLFVQAKADMQEFSFSVSTKDSIIDIDLNAKGNFNDSIIVCKANIDLNNFSLQKANLLEKRYDIKFTSIADLTYNLNNNNTEFHSHFSELSTCDSIKTNSINKLDVNFTHNNKITAFDLQSDNNSVNLAIKGNLSNLVSSFNKIVDIFTLQRKEGDSLFLPDMKLYANFSNPNDLIGQTFSEYLPNYSKLFIDGDYKSKTGKFNFNLSVPNFEYHGNSFDSTSVKFYGDKHFLDYELISNIQIDSILNTKIKLDGKLKNQILSTHINLSDKDKQEDFLNINLVSRKISETYNVQIIDSALVILSNHWNINKTNKFLIGSKDLVAHNFNLYRNDKKISIKTDTIKNDIVLILQSIDLSVFNNILSNDTLLAGIANFNLKASYQNNIKNIRADANIQDFKYNNIYIGSVELSKAILSKKHFTYEIGLKQSRESIKSKGIINFGDKQSINADFEINSFDMIFLQDLFKEYLYSTKGEINSKIKIAGTLENPVLNGYLSFADAQFGIKEIDEIFKIGKERIIFEDDKIFFEDFNLIDKNNHRINFEGNIKFSSNDLVFNDVTVEAQDFEIMNSEYTEKNPVYGLVVADLMLHANGKIDKLKMRTKISLDYPSYLKYIFSEDLSTENHSDIVNFTKIDTLQIVDTLIEQSISKYKRKFSIFDDLDAELEIKEGCKFNLFFDRSKENFFDVKVKGKVKYVVNSGMSETYGTIDILQGNMSYSMPMVTMNKLKVEDGSFIQITDNIENPFISVNTSSKIWASTGNLIDNYNKNLEISVYMFMRGNIDNLVMQFDISPETNDPLVSSKISQMSKNERSGNAVNLLVRGQFETSQNAASTIDIGAYINSMFATGLNKLISDRVKFVDMNFDIRSFDNVNSRGAIESQSNLFFNVQKGFYNNRLRIKYSSNMTTTLIQQDNQIGQLNSYTHRNFFIEYDINKLGTFQSILFRKDAYEDIIEGDIISTGGGLKIRKNYNSFGDIFKFGSNKK